MKIDGVFSGGGVKAYAYLGVLKSIEENRLSLERVAGTSAGAIIAALVAAQYKESEIKEIITGIDLNTFLDAPRITKLIPYSKWILLYFKKGLYKGDVLEQFLYLHLARKGIYTFKHIEKDYLKVVISDLSLGRLIVLPDDLYPVYGIDPNHFSVAKAVRMSAGFPYFFMPKEMKNKKNQKSIIVDGGLLSNFPLWLFDPSQMIPKRPILGVKLTDANKHPTRQIDNAFEMFSALFSAMKQAHDTRYISKSKTENVVFIPVENTDTLAFDLDKQAQDKLITNGKNYTDRFLQRWPK